MKDNNEKEFVSDWINNAVKNLNLFIKQVKDLSDRVDKLEKEKQSSNIKEAEFKESKIVEVELKGSILDDRYKKAPAIIFAYSYENVDLGTDSHTDIELKSYYRSDYLKEYLEKKEITIDNEEFRLYMEEREKEVKKYILFNPLDSVSISNPTISLKE